MKKILFMSLTIIGSLFYSCQEDSVQPLSVSFSSDKQNVVAGGDVTFKDESLGQPSKWAWYFEGANPDSSFLSGPTVKYGKPGTYLVTLMISNSEQTVSETKEAFITVGYNEVLANFEATSLNIMEGQVVEFKDLSGGFIESWAWAFSTESGANLTSAEQNPVMKFDEAGTYDVKLVVSNAEYSDEKILPAYITVLDPANLNAGFAGNHTGTYEGGAIAFTDQSIGLVTGWAWEFEGGSPATSNEQNPTVTYNAIGRYKVKLVVSNSVVSKEVVKEGYVVVMPVADLGAYFPFGGNLADAGPNQLAPEIRGTVTLEGTNRKDSQNDAAVFNGTGGLIIPDHAAFNFGTDDYSVSCWIKTNKTNRMLIWQESGDLGSKDNQTWMRLGANTTTQLLGLATEDAIGGSFLGLSEAEGGKMYDDVWHHVVCVRQGLITMVYIDGMKAKEASSKSGVKNVSNAAPFKIGMQGGASGFSNFFNGLLDDMVIYNKALSETEIILLYNL